MEATEEVMNKTWEERELAEKEEKKDKKARTRNTGEAKEMRTGEEGGRLLQSKIRVNEGKRKRKKRTSRYKNEPLLNASNQVK